MVFTLTYSEELNKFDTSYKSNAFPYGTIKSIINENENHLSCEYYEDNIVIGKLIARIDQDLDLICDFCTTKMIWFQEKINHLEIQIQNLDESWFSFIRIRYYRSIYDNLYSEFINFLNFMELNHNAILHIIGRLNTKCDLDIEDHYNYRMSTSLYMNQTIIDNIQNIFRKIYNTIFNYETKSSSSESFRERINDSSDNNDGSTNKIDSHLTIRKYKHHDGLIDDIRDDNVNNFSITDAINDDSINHYCSTDNIHSCDHNDNIHQYDSNDNIHQYDDNENIHQFDANEQID